jgi:hypothetical protein
VNIYSRIEKTDRKMRIFIQESKKHGKKYESSVKNRKNTGETPILQKIIPQADNSLLMLRRQTIAVWFRLNRSPAKGWLAEGKALYYQRSNVLVYPKRSLAHFVYPCEVYTKYAVCNNLINRQLKITNCVYLCVISNGGTAQCHWEAKK